VFNFSVAHVFLIEATFWLESVVRIEKKNLVGPIRDIREIDTRFEFVKFSYGLYNRTSYPAGVFFGKLDKSAGSRVLRKSLQKFKSSSRAGKRSGGVPPSGPSSSGVIIKTI
jgi:hypothetical protein